MIQQDLTIFGATLEINPTHFTPRGTVVVDVETDERDHFTGLALCDGRDRVAYFSRLDPWLVSVLENATLVGHNIKADAKWLRGWGVQIRAEQLAADTMLMSYVVDTTKESHGLKDLAKELLRREYPSYKQIVGKGKKKLTLDKHPVEVVAAYCGADAVCTYELWQYFQKKMTPQQRRVLDELDLPLMRLLFEMELTGIRVDRTYLETLRERFSRESKDKEMELAAAGLRNPRSPKQVKEWLGSKGIRVESTNKATLQSLTAPCAKDLLTYRRTHKLLTTYVEPLLEKSITDGRVRCKFNQITYEQSDDQWTGIRTGRLSSSEPNLQNIPVRSDEGRLLRKAFVPDPGSLLLCADYAQIEYRLLAHFAEDELLIQAFLDGKDVHNETGKAIGGDRKLGKNINFAAIYGAGAGKVAEMVGCSKEKAQSFLDSYWEKLPKVKHWINGVKKKAYQDRGIQTFFGRWIPLPQIRSYIEPVRWHWERAAVNYIIQGSAAEILKKGMLAAVRRGYQPLITVHDENLFNVWPDAVDDAKATITDAMSNVVKLRVPLVVKVGVGGNWDAAK